jgi:hypothetical protein
MLLELEMADLSIFLRKMTFVPHNLQIQPPSFSINFPYTLFTKNNLSEISYILI